MPEGSGASSTQGAADPRTHAKTSKNKGKGGHEALVKALNKPIEFALSATEQGEAEARLTSATAKAHAAQLKQLQTLEGLKAEMSPHKDESPQRHRYAAVSRQVDALDKILFPR